MTAEETATTQPAEGSIPDELIGTWRTTLAPKDIPASAPPELTEGGREWELVIAETGAPDGGPVLSIVNSREGHLEGPALDVEDDRLLLEQEECADRVAETILTSQPWRRASKA
jgi:hypothetical protein